MPRDIPNLPEMRRLTREDRQAVSAHLAGLGPGQSELTFTNLFIWQHAYQLRVAEVGRRWRYWRRSA